MNKSLLIIPILLLFARVMAFGENVILAWNTESDPTVTGYNLHEGISPHTYTNVINVGNATSVTVSNLVPGVTYYFAVTAYDFEGLESPFSSEVSYSAPSLPVFVTQPASSTNSYGSSSTMSASAAGSGITYQWFFNSEPISGATSNSITFNFMTWTNDGSYTLQASNAAGITVSTTAVIAVAPPVVTNVRVVGP